jgi:hypothetical protein
MKQRMMAVVGLGAVAVLLSVGLAWSEPRYLKKEDVNGAMQSFSKALGVQCSYCHLPKADPDKQGETQLSADAQAEIRSRFHVARAMLVMTNFANKRGGDPATCNTCHQGKAQPGSK